jgi:hypothetical protein
MVARRVIVDRLAMPATDPPPHTVQDRMRRHAREVVVALVLTLAAIAFVIVALPR